jgi:conjugal transfer pilus assembly protein TraW
MIQDTKMLGWSIKIGLLGLVILFSNSALAKDAGVIGPTYPIAEEDAIDTIKNNIKKKDPEEIKRKFIEEIRKEGEVNLNIPETTVAVNKYIEPQAILSGDIRDDKGKVLYPKGTVFNPIEKMMGKKMYLIFDGTSSRQITWVKKNRIQTLPVKLIATRGNVFDLSKELKTMVYPGKREIVEALQVKSVPSRITQEGKLLHVEAVMP